MLAPLFSSRSSAFSAEAALPVLQANQAMIQNQIFMAQDMIRASLNNDKHLLDFLA